MQIIFQDFFLPKTESLGHVSKLFSFSFWKGLLGRRVLSAIVACSLFQAQVASAQQNAKPTGPSFTEALMQMLPLFAMVMIIYYFMIAKPQQLKIKSQAEMLGSLKKGDSIVTTSGLFGKVVSVDGESIQLEISPNVKVKLESAHVARKSDSVEKT